MGRPICGVLGGGSEATLADFEAHYHDTHEHVDDYPGRSAWRIYPDIIAGVRWDHDKRDWRVSGSHITAFYLDMHDPDLSDEQIEVQMYALPTVYRCVIIRPRLRLHCISTFGRRWNM